MREVSGPKPRLRTVSTSSKVSDALPEAQRLLNGVSARSGVPTNHFVSIIQYRQALQEAISTLISLANCPNKPWE
jgi:hypothetical protein